MAPANTPSAECPIWPSGCASGFASSITALGWKRNMCSVPRVSSGAAVRNGRRGRQCRPDARAAAGCAPGTPPGVTTGLRENGSRPPWPAGHGARGRRCARPRPRPRPRAACVRRRRRRTDAKAVHPLACFTGESSTRGASRGDNPALPPTARFAP